MAGSPGAVILPKKGKTRAATTRVFRLGGRDYTVFSCVCLYFTGERLKEDDKWLKSRLKSRDESGGQIHLAGP